MKSKNGDEGRKAIGVVPETNTSLTKLGLDVTEQNGWFSFFMVLNHKEANWK